MWLIASSPLNFSKLAQSQLFFLVRFSEFSQRHLGFFQIKGSALSNLLFIIFPADFSVLLRNARPGLYFADLRPPLLQTSSCSPAVNFWPDPFRIFQTRFYFLPLFNRHFFSPRSRPCYETYPFLRMTRPVFHFSDPRPSLFQTSPSSAATTSPPPWWPWFAATDATSAGGGSGHKNSSGGTGRVRFWVFCKELFLRMLLVKMFNLYVGFGTVNRLNEINWNAGSKRLTG